MTERKAIFRIILLLGSLLVASLGVSAGWRIYEHFFVSRVHPKHYDALKAKLDYNPHCRYQFDEELSYRLKPLFEGERHGATGLVHRTNERGLLGVCRVRPGNKQKILFLGDSVTYGHALAYEEVFSTDLQSQLGDGYEVFNAGCPGWSTHQELIYYDRYLSDVEWDTVFLVFCMNDLVRFEWVYKDDSTFIMSQDVRSLDDALAASSDSLRLGRLRKKFASEAGTAPLAVHSNAVLTAWTDSPWAGFEADLSGFLQKLSNSPPPPRFVVLVIPTWPQLVALSRGGKAETILRPQAQLMRICQRLGVEFLDGGEAFMRHTIDQNVFMDDLHLGKDGHRWLADYLAGIMRYNRKLWMRKERAYPSDS
ncbi:MAG: SGNH/GDSL hydrolase family protein [Verrucomicrobia bacterium]|nr:SGNH/GDSL hydrolase family protein [Verrucomicrobiota bacterium]